ncbi:EAL domain-containing protein [Marinomonas rhizomae]|uniref:EAL domain-containing protein (Putative c-di-GMP-specific phosphodiesterase class I) n=1 Tax=Marinomonas rhizomae TaxID=491948 RepID=A0A366JAL5_9GAMM|nr:EAL domain-containing protein [Marinomonas rhizomae]RBP83907.1 EAL domain-containing protein (putative c-di-GMP-specific phosphodiesterase class I) [Marinomonas rhizomae]RNF73388.1 EAL domain-containing protein [Marinomonas rhizomae]
MLKANNSVDLMAAIWGVQNQSKIEKETSAGSLHYDLGYLVQTIRQHLGVDIAFLSRFQDGHREMLHVDKSESCRVFLNTGHKDINEVTYCHLIAEEKLPNIIPDTSKNDITKALAITKALNIGSYIGVPIYLSDDSIYGTLCCFSEHADESLSNKDLSILMLFAKFAARNIEKELTVSRLHEAARDNIFDIIHNRQLSIVLQPIYDFRTRSIKGFECLSRFQTEPYRSPDYWFNKANASGFGEVLELFAIEEALNQLPAIPEQYYIALNVSPKHLASPHLQAMLDKVPLHRIVLEVTERESIPDYKAFRSDIQRFRDKGMRLAVDDAGAGFASFQHILELQADIIKLDRSLIADINTDHRKRALVAALIGFAKETKSKVLGEGVETLAELEVLQELGAQKIQGYFFCHPLPLKDALAFCEIRNSNT